jgi:S-formylglutathione hydrolase
VMMDVGTKDTLLASNQQLHAKLTQLHVPHYYEEYDGDHTNRVGERLERTVLPFFAKSMVAAANPTSPQIKD